MKYLKKNIIAYGVGVLLMTPVVSMYKISRIQYDAYCCGSTQGHVRLIGGPLFSSNNDKTGVYWSRMGKTLEPEYNSSEDFEWEKVYSIETSDLASNGYAEGAELRERVKFLIFTGFESAIILLPVFAMAAIMTKYKHEPKKS